MTTKWYYAKGDERLGPVDDDVFRQLADSGGLEPFDRVWKKGMKQWLPAASVPGVLSNATPASVHEWYYAEGTEQRGPVSFERLEHLVAERKLGPSDWVWNESLDEWKSVSHAAELQPAVQGNQPRDQARRESSKATSSNSPATQVKVIEADSTPLLRTNDASRSLNSRSHAGLPWTAWTAIVFIVLELIDKPVAAVMATLAGQMSLSFLVGMFAGVVRNSVLFAVCLSLIGVTQQYLGFRFTNTRASKIGFGIVGGIAILYFVVREFGQLTQWYAILGYQISLVSSIVHILAVVAGVCGLLHFSISSNFNRSLVLLSVSGLLGYAVLASIAKVIGLANGSYDTTIAWNVVRNVFAIVQAGVAAVIVWKVMQLHWEQQPLPPKRAIKSDGGNADRSTPTEGLKGWLAGLWSNTQAAGLIVAKQAEKTKLTNVTLPAAYRELGRNIYGEGRLRGELTIAFEELDGLAAELAQLSEKSATPSSPQSVSQKAKGIADSAKRMTQQKVVEQKLNQAYAALGKIAFEQHGEACGPENLTSQVTQHQERFDALGTEIGDLSSAGQSHIVTPKRIVIAGGAILTTAVGWAIFSMTVGSIGSPSISRCDFSAGPNGEPVEAFEDLWGTSEPIYNYRESNPPNDEKYRKKRVYSAIVLNEYVKQAHGPFVRYHDKSGSQKWREGTYCRNMRHGKLIGWYENGQQEFERWFDHGKPVATHRGFSDSGTSVWEVSFDSDGHPVWNDAMCESFVYHTAVSLFDRSDWKWSYLPETHSATLEPSPPIAGDCTIFRLSSNRRLSKQTMDFTFGPPDDVRMTGRDRGEQQWIFRLRDGTVWMNVFVVTDDEYILSAPGVIVSGKREF